MEQFLNALSEELRKKVYKQLKASKVYEDDALHALSKDDWVSFGFKFGEMMQIEEALGVEF